MDLLVRATQRRAWAAGQNTSAARPRLAEAGGQREAGGRPELDLALAGGVSKLEGELEGESAEASGRPYPT